MSAIGNRSAVAALASGSGLGPGLQIDPGSGLGPGLQIDPGSPVDRTVPLGLAAPAQPERLIARGRAILARRGILAGDHETLTDRLIASGVGCDCRDGLGLLLASIAARDPEQAQRAAQALIGLGPGLTPEGDDLLAGASAVVWACAGTAGWSDAERTAWLRAVASGELRERTTEVSAALLRSATAGHAFPPLRTVLDLHEDARWAEAVQALVRIGSTTGRAYAAAAGAAAYLCSTATTNQVYETDHG